MTNPLKSAAQHPAQARQAGSTLLGIIIGLIVGLAIAVVVALVITKGASPFTNKNGKPNASESAGNPIVDPNKPLYGNTQPAREAAKEFAREGEPAASPAASPAVASPAPAATASPSPAPKLAEARPGAVISPSPSPIPSPSPVTLAKANPTASPTTAAENPEEKWIYYLQAGAFREPTDAENTRAKLALLGFEATISERSSDNGVLFRVRMGPFNQVEAMNRARAKLSENGVDVAVIRNQK